MKLNTLKTLTLVVMLLVSAGAMAADTFIYKLNGGNPGNYNPGVVTLSKTGTKGTITVTPSAGYYLIVENLKVVKTIDGSNAQTRIDINTPVTITPTDANADLSGVTTYTFDITDRNYEYEITADFSERINITNATVELAEGQTLKYTGEAIKPNLVVTLGTATLTAGTDYNAYYQDSINAGTGKIMLVGISRYTGSCGTWENPAKTYTIAKGTITLTYSSDKAEAKVGETFTAPTLNNPSKVAVTYSSSKTDVATISSEGAVTLVGPGETTISAAFAGDGNLEATTASYVLTVVKMQDAGLSWTDEGMEYYIGDYWYGPRLNNPNKLKVKYKSSDEDVATIDENGVVTVVGVGDTWIMAIFEGSDEYEPQTVRYGLFVKERYNLWVDGNQVTSENCRDILGDGQFFYDEDKKMLVVTNSTKAVDIENRKGDLTIFLNGNSKLGRIFFNKGETENSGKLTITTYENIPGATTLETSDANGVISGFSSLTIDEESYTFLLDPTKGQYQGGKLVTAEGAVAQTAIIGQYIKPLVNGQTVTFPPGDFDLENLTNAVIKDLLMTLLMDLGTSQVETDDDYYDASENCIVLNNLNSTNGVAVVVDNVQKGQYIPGSSDFAAAFKGGITFMVPNGEGKIILNVQTEPGYKLMLMIGNGTPTEIVKNERGDVEVDYNVEKPTYCYIYLDQTAGTRGTRIGKREKSHGKVFSLKVSPAKSLSTNPLGGVPGFPDSKTPEVDTFGENDPTGINEIKVETDNTLEGNDDNWYDLQGRMIDKPTKAGIYIQNRKKIVIR